MTKNKKIWVAILAIAVIGLIGWRVNKGRRSVSGPIKVGVSSLMTGDFAVVGENILKSAELTVDKINKAGGVNGRQIEIISEDAACDGQTGLSAVSKLINVDGVRYIVGGMCSNGTVAAAPVINQNKVVDLTPVTGGKDVDNAGEYIFRTANSDTLAGKDIADAMIGLGYKKAGIVSEVTEYTLDLTKSFKEAFTAHGGGVVVEDYFQPGTSDFRTTITKMKGSGVETVLVASQTGIGGAFFVKQSRDLGFRPSMFSDFTFVANSDAKKIVGSFDGMYFADPAYDSQNPDLLAFFKQYENRYGNPPRQFHSTQQRLMMRFI